MHEGTVISVRQAIHATKIVKTHGILLVGLVVAGSSLLDPC